MNSGDWQSLTDVYSSEGRPRIPNLCGTLCEQRGPRVICSYPSRVYTLTLQSQSQDKLSISHVDWWHTHHYSEQNTPSPPWVTGPQGWRLMDKRIMPDPSHVGDKLWIHLISVGIVSNNYGLPGLTDPTQTPGQLVCKVACHNGFHSSTATTHHNVPLQHLCCSGL